MISLENCYYPSNEYEGNEIEFDFIHYLTLEGISNKSETSKFSGEYQNIFQAGLNPAETTYKNIGSFFRVTTPREFGEVHLLRLLITVFLEGKFKDFQAFRLLVYEFSERIISQGLRLRNFRIKWKKRGLFRIIEKLTKETLPFLFKRNYSKAILKYKISNSINQVVPLEKFIIPKKNRDDSPLERIKIFTIQRFEPPKKRVSKRISLSAGDKGSGRNLGIPWKEVADKEIIFHQGKWIKVYQKDKPDPTTIEGVVT